MTGWSGPFRHRLPADATRSHTDTTIDRVRGRKDARCHLALARHLFREVLPLRLVDFTFCFQSGGLLLLLDSLTLLLFQHLVPLVSFPLFVLRGLSSRRGRTSGRVRRTHGLQHGNLHARQETQT